MTALDTSGLLAVSATLGACADRFPLCSVRHLQRVALPRALWPHLEIVQPRLGIARLARALGVGVRGLDLWVCGPGLCPDKAADVAARFARLVDHMQKQAGRCTCRLCTPTATEKARERAWGRRAGPDRMVTASCQCTGRFSPTEAA